MIWLFLSNTAFTVNLWTDQLQSEWTVDTEDLFSHAQHKRINKENKLLIGYVVLILLGYPSVSTDFEKGSSFDKTKQNKRLSDKDT